jgi:hypothetical protein
MKISGTQVLMIRHHDTDHDHLHIVYNRVNNEGKTISDSNQRWNNVKASKALTLKYGFHMAQGKDRVNRQRLKGADKIKYQLHDQIKAILPKVKSMAELQKQLAKQGINMQYKYKSGTQEIQGISFSKGGYQFKGSEIDRILSYGKISKAISDRMQQQELEQLEKPVQPKSLADELRDVLKQSSNEIHYLKQEPKTNYLGAIGIDISDDVDDEAIYGRNRRRQEKARTNTR